VDERTLAAYDAEAARFSADWLAQPAPDDLQELWRRFLVPGAPTADIGCGNGRDCDWLNRVGYPCTGYDASPVLLAEAHRLHPAWRFERACLPGLAEIGDGVFGNVICETVLMHLERGEVAAAVRSLDRILAPGGVIYLSWRTARGADTRDGLGRLYSAFDPGVVREALAGWTPMLDTALVSVSSGKPVHRIVARKPVQSGA